MMKKRSFSFFLQHRLHLYPPLVQLVTFVVFHIYSPPPCQIISPLHSLRLHRLHPCPPFVTFEKFVVFQIHSPPSEGSGEVPSTPSPAPSPSLSTIRDIRGIRSLSNTLPSFGGVGGGPLHPSSVSFLYVSTIGAISEIRSLVSISAF